MRKFLAGLLLALLLTPNALAVKAAEADALDLSADSAILMEQSTGTILYEKDAHTRRAPASVTKVMTLLLIAEAVERGSLQLTDTVPASETAAGMGGSQIWLEAGETMTVDEMIKCIAVVSANDCAVAMAEKLAGSERAFAEKMNARAKELGMTDTHYVNCTGLTDDPEHYTSAWDIALVSQALLSHTWIRDYTTIWMDEVRDGAFGLSNTNRLVRNYEGCTGLKTGFTQEAMYCLSASAERDGIGFIAVVLHAPTSDQRFSDAAALLNYGFSNYTLWSAEANVALPPVRVTLGETDSVQPVPDGDTVLIDQDGGAVQYEILLPDSVEAPVRAGETLGTLRLTNDQGVAAELRLLASADVQRLTVWQIWARLLRAV